MRGGGATESHASDTFDRSLLRRALLLTSGLHITAVTLVLKPEAIDAFELPKAIASYAFGAGEVLLIAAILIRFGIGVWPRSRIQLFVFGLVAWYALATWFAIDRYVAVFGERSRDAGLLTALAGLALYVAFAVSFRRPRDVVVVGLPVALSLAVVIGYALLQTEGRDPAFFFTRPNAGRVFSTLGTPNALGHYLAVAFATLFATLALVPTLPTRYRFPIAAAAGLCLIAGLPALSRDMLIGASTGVLAVMLFWLRGLASLRQAPQLMAGMLLFGAMVGLSLEGPLGERVLEGETLDRQFIYGSALQVLAERPLVGVGPDNFGAIYPAARLPGAEKVPGLSEWQTSTHSWLLQIGINGGMPAVALALLAVLVTFAAAWGARAPDPSSAVTVRIAFVALAAYLGAAMVSVESIGVDWVWWASLGIIAGIGGRRRSSTASSPRRRLLMLPLVITAAILAVVIAVTGVRGPVRAAELAAVAHQFWSEDPRAAVRSASRAVVLDSGRSQYWNVLGLALEASGDLHEAAKAFRQSTSRSPYLAHYWWNLARVSLLGTWPEANDEALLAARRGFEADPRNAESHYQLALTAYRLRQLESALAAAENAQRLFPSDQRFRRLAASAKEVLENP